MLELNQGNYFSAQANREYMSASQFKSFNGTFGRGGCEAAALARMYGDWKDEPSTALMVGSYVDHYFEGTLAEFKAENPQMFKRDGTLKAEFVKAEQIIQRAERDPLFMRYMSGDKQVIMTGEIGGVPWKIKMDSYIPGVAIVDLKVMQSLTKLEWVRDVGYMDFVRYWSYDIQGAVYQYIVEQNTGEHLPFYIAGLSKEKEPNIEIIYVADVYLQEALDIVERNLPDVLAVKNGEREPRRCECCDYCRHTKVLQRPIGLADLASNIY